MLLDECYSLEVPKTKYYWLQTFVVHCAHMYTVEQRELMNIPIDLM